MSFCISKCDYVIFLSNYDKGLTRMELSKIV